MYVHGYVHACYYTYVFVCVCVWHNLSEDTDLGGRFVDLHRGADLCHGFAYCDL